jgi:hypothetical protein
MLSHNHKLNHALSLVDTEKLIPIIQQGIEIERLHLHVSDSQDAAQRIFEAEVFLSLVRFQSFSSHTTTR